MYSFWERRKKNKRYLVWWDLVPQKFRQFVPGAESPACNWFNFNCVFIFFQNRSMSNAFIILLAKKPAACCAGPDSSLSATETALIPISLLKHCHSMCIQHHSYCLCSLPCWSSQRGWNVSDVLHLQIFFFLVVFWCSFASCLVWWYMLGIQQVGIVFRQAVRGNWCKLLTSALWSCNP